MDASWKELVALAFRPQRPRLSHASQWIEAHGKAIQHAAFEHARALAHCEGRIEAARAAIFANGDGIVPSAMTALEQEWLTLARGARQSERHIAEGWSEMSGAPPDQRPRWHAHRPDAAWRAAIALASDPDGVRRAEVSIFELASVLGSWRTQLGAPVAWIIEVEPSSIVNGSELFDGPARASTEALSAIHGGSTTLERADQAAEAVLVLARVRALPASIASVMSFVARVDFVWNACVAEGLRVPEGHPHAGKAFADIAHPIAPWTALSQTGYVLHAADIDGVTLSAPSIP